jgi:hypothetical protein
MALLPLNVFKTKTAKLQSTWSTGTTATVYTAPVGVTAIILMTQVANTDPVNPHAVTFKHYRNLPILKNAQGYGGQDPHIATPLVVGYQIPPNDAASMTTGKMIIEQLDSVFCYADADDVCFLTLSVLETANS